MSRYRRLGELRGTVPQRSKKGKSERRRRKRVDGRRWTNERSGSAGKGQEWDRKCVTDGRMDGWMAKQRMMGRMSG